MPVRTIRYLAIIAVVVALISGTVVWAMVIQVFQTETRADKTTDTLSAQFANDAEKIAFLKQYLTLHSEIEGTEFHIRYYDHSMGLVPGPSDWDIQVVLKIAPENLSAWTSGWQLGSSQNVDLSWGYALLPQEPRWKVESQPAVSIQLNDVMAVFEQEGILFRRIWTQ